ncbi:helix-turn-helix transcriptional regulator [Paenibacillus sp. 481]|uniref:helix-turn-helix transcriptional regulator n=1 Tax=Paenibacillus sp. 481 TaxID=2835869 RepID=UPI001E600A2E|nr:hybrid sensor histidine kinase/response regulator transcription factor [Paenibacillus sp. 481]UHA75596.1 hybrid sensor histidine kinase/response regulator transcription factor [Paenibacillus sp. 481]
MEIKKWYWYDWMISIIRTLWLLNIVIVAFINPQYFNAPIWFVLLLAFLVYSIPVFIQQFSNKWFLVVEIAMAGAFHLYLTYALPENSWQIAIFIFLIGYASNRESFWWSLLSCAAIVLPIMGWIRSESLLEALLAMPFNGTLYFMFGYAIQTLVLNYKQSLVIKEQKRVLEQHLLQIEELTLKEERNRLSHELHDTIGHTLTSLVVGMESLRPSLTDSQSERIAILTGIARNGLDDIRKHLHELAPTPLKESLGDSLQQLMDEFSQSTGITIHFKRFGTEVPITNQMSFCLYRCMQESLTNAARHGQATIINVQLYFDPEQLRLQIEDNGVGMEDVRHGFGLTGIKDRLAQWRGSLMVHSTLHEGTVVICTLPVAEEEAVEHRIRLLLVDDQPIITESLQHILEQRAGVSVIATAQDGQSALEQCATHEPDIVLMDVQMTGMNGIDALQAMKQRWPDMKIVLMTTFEDAVQAATALEGGADGYMLKSIQPQEMISALKLIYTGGTWIDQSISPTIFAHLKQQREQSEKSISAPTELPYGITKREQEILRYLSEGLRYKSIAARLFLSEGTVRNYCSTLYSKLGVSNREAAVDAARSEGML